MEYIIVVWKCYAYVWIVYTRHNEENVKLLLLNNCGNSLWRYIKFGCPRRKCHNKSSLSLLDLKAEIGAPEVGSFEKGFILRRYSLMCGLAMNFPARINVVIRFLAFFAPQVVLELIFLSWLLNSVHPVKQKEPNQVGKMGHGAVKWGQSHQLLRNSAAKSPASLCNGFLPVGPLRRQLGGSVMALCSVPNHGHHRDLDLNPSGIWILAYFPQLSDRVSRPCCMSIEIHRWDQFSAIVESGQGSSLQPSFLLGVDRAQRIQWRIARPCYLSKNMSLWPHPKCL